MYGYIYKTIFIIDNRLYIGQKKGNFKFTYLGSGKHLKLAIKKYGYKNFKVKLIDIAIDQKDLDNKEKFWIKFYRNLLGQEKLFNLSDGGKNERTLSGFYSASKNNKYWLGRKHTEETKRKMSEIQKKVNQDPKVRVRKSKARIGKKHSEETKKKFSEIRKGKNLANFSREHFIKMALKRGVSWNKGLTKENDKRMGKMSETKKSKHYSAWNKGLTVRTDTRLKTYGDKRKGYITPEMIKSKISNTLKNNSLYLYIFYSPCGIKHITNNNNSFGFVEFCKYHNLNTSMIYKYLKQNNHNYKGWAIYRYENNR
jgi:group I intron endonuclease